MVNAWSIKMNEIGCIEHWAHAFARHSRMHRCWTVQASLTSPKTISSHHHNTIPTTCAVSNWKMNNYSPKVKTIKILVIQQPCLSLTKTIGKCHVKETSCSISLQYCMLHRYSSGINLVPRILSVTWRLQIEPWDKIARIQSKFVKPTWPLRRRKQSS